MNYDTFNRRLAVSRETYDRLAAYHSLLIKWQARINLISPQTIPEIWERHILDSCQFYSIIVSRGTSGPIIDLGSGAGLPGLILALLGLPDIHLVESDGRKCVFLQEVARGLALDCTIHHQRIEQVVMATPAFITARGCAPLPRLLSLAYPLLCEQTSCLFAKGKNYATELEDARAVWDFESVIHPSQTEPGAALLELSAVTPKG